jgi:hypothetical protein
VVGVVPTYQYTKEIQYCWELTTNVSVKMRRSIEGTIKTIIGTKTDLTFQKI